VLANFADLADCADGALELGVVLAAVEGARLKARAAVDGRVAGGTDFELGKLVELDLDGVVGVALALRLDLLCLFCVSVSSYTRIIGRLSKHTLSTILLAPPLAMMRLAKLKAEL
jgi:hypothetical protein